jgi:hypothetical protein
MTFSEWYRWSGAVEPGGPLRWLHWLAMAVYAGGAPLFLCHTLEPYRRGARHQAGGSTLVVSGLGILLARGSGLSRMRLSRKRDSLAPSLRDTASSCFSGRAGGVQARPHRRTRGGLPDGPRRQVPRRLALHRSDRDLPRRPRAEPGHRDDDVDRRRPGRRRGGAPGCGCG